MGTAGNNLASGLPAPVPLTEEDIDQESTQLVARVDAHTAPLDRPLDGAIRLA